VSAVVPHAAIFAGVVYVFVVTRAVTPKAMTAIKRINNFFILSLFRLLNCGVNSGNSRVDVSHKDDTWFVGVLNQTLIPGEQDS